MAKDLILKSTNVDDKRPTSSQLEIGEISLGYNEAGAFLCCKDTAGNIQQVGGIRFSEDAPGTPVKGTLWLKPSTFILYGFNGEYWLPVASGGGGGGGGAVSEIIAGDGIDVAPTTGIGVVTLNTDIDGNRGIEIVAGRLAINPGIGLQFDSSGALAVTNQAMVYGGTVDLTSSTAQPSNPNNGQVYANTTSGTSNSVWAPDLAVGTSVEVADLVVWNNTTSKWDYYPTGSTVVNVCDLSISNRTATSLDIDSSTGADATVPAASQSQAGLMSASDKNLFDNTLKSDGSADFSGPVTINGATAFFSSGITVKGNIATEAPAAGAEAKIHFVSTTGHGVASLNADGDNSSGYIDFYTRKTGTNYQRARIDSSGNFKLGGTLPSAPEISLNSNGSAEFGAGRLSIGAGGKITQNVSAGSTGSLINLKNDSTTVFAVLPSGYTKIGGSNIDLSSDGSSTFQGELTINRPTGSPSALVIRENNVENIKFKPSGQALFNGPVSIGGTAAINTIDLYEEGSYTPSLTSSTGADPTQSYASQSASYVRIGKLCSVKVLVKFASSGVSAGTGNMRVNLPFNVSGYPAGAIGISKSFTANLPVAIQGSNNSAFVSLKSNFSNDNCGCDTVQNNSQISFSLVYEVA